MKRTADNGITPEHVRWAYRLFLDREPENERVLSRRAPDTKTLRRDFINTTEYQTKNPRPDLLIDKWVIVTTKLGFRINVSLSELGVSRPILYDEYEPDAVALFKSMVKPGDRVIDVGANIGFHSLVLCQLVGPTGRILSFEPVKYLYDALTASIIENRFQDRCQACHCAISDRSGRTLIRHAIGTTNFGGGHLAETRQDDGHAYDEVDVKTLSQVIASERCSFIKIDAEGAEAKVLRGAVDLLQRDKPLIFVELFNAQLQRVSGINATALIKFMVGHGYQCFTTPDGKPGPQLREYDAPSIINVLFIPIP